MPDLTCTLVRFRVSANVRIAKVKGHEQRNLQSVPLEITSPLCAWVTADKRDEIASALEMMKDEIDDAHSIGMAALQR
ncbi:hypothetical protein CDAR_314341 [Caerostris darwini]|uniref:Uncharacterized protein n=1 Tax=Caerostris darwini TaxID=1538125 RepID=A0AAV4TYQ4_9ARAC|nr:hypothetical protein CDAR_314341 [Caerostris darwini]